MRRFNVLLFALAALCLALVFAVSMLGTQLYHLQARNENQYQTILALQQEPEAVQL